MTRSVLPSAMPVYPPSRVYAALIALWHRVRGPLEQHSDIRQMRQSQLLAMVEALMIASMLPAIGLSAHERSPMGLVLAGATGLMSLSFCLNRKLQYHRAVGLALLVMAALPFASLCAQHTLTSEAAISTLIWPTLNIFLGASLVRARRLVLMGMIHVAGLIVLARLAPQLWPWPLAMLLNFYITLCLGVLVASRHNAVLDHDRFKQVLDANRGLQALKDSLEIRVVERTQALAQSNTRLEKAFETLQFNQKQLLMAEKMASLGRLTAGIAHEVNSPLSAVRNAFAQLELLAKEYHRSVEMPEVSIQDHKEIAEEMLSTLALATKSAEQIQGFVRGIKSQTQDISCSDADSFAVQPVVDEALMLLAHSIRNYGVAVEFEKGPDFIMLYGAPGRLSQILTNLLQNALEACEGRPNSRITIEVQETDKTVELRVCDNGIGISEENLPKVFDPMFSTKRFGESSGLGLTMVHDLVTGHFGGIIEVQSQPGQGTVVLMTFPSADQAYERKSLELPRTLVGLDSPLRGGKFQ